MWIPRNPDKIRKAHSGLNSYPGAFFIVFVLMVPYVYLKFHRQIGDHPDSHALLGVICIAAGFCLFGVAGAALQQKYGWRLELFHGSGIVVGGKNMLCKSCWSVQPFRRAPVCEHCGGECEDAELWTWQDDKPQSTEAYHAQQ